MRIKEHETRLTLQEHDDDDNNGAFFESFSWDTCPTGARIALLFLTTSIQSGQRRNLSPIPGIGKAMLLSSATYEYVMGAGASFASHCPLPS